MGSAAGDLVERWCIALREFDVLEPWLTESHWDDHYWHNVAAAMVARVGDRPESDAALVALRLVLAETFEGVDLAADGGFYRDNLDRRLELVVAAALSKDSDR